jgi:hypothetical protein
MTDISVTVDLMSQKNSVEDLKLSRRVLLPSRRFVRLLCTKNRIGEESIGICSKRKLAIKAGHAKCHVSVPLI